jgi:predicted secreted protein
MAPAGPDPLLRAARTLDELGLDQERPVDVLAAVDGLGLTLAFVPLDRLLGAVVPHGAGGVLVTTQRGIGVQRYTAAHEIGHWVMHQGRLMVDDAEDVLGPPTSELEAQAQSFAAYFLMPPPLLWASLRELRLNKGDIGPGDAYRLSRELNVSYEAAVRRLASLGWLDRPQTRALLAVQRLAAMAAAFGGRRPAQGAAELWEAGLPSNGRTLTVTVDDEVVVDLPENRTTPYRWLDAESLAARPAGARPRPRPPARSNARADAPAVAQGGGPTATTAPAAARAALALLPSPPATRHSPPPAGSWDATSDFDPPAPVPASPTARSRQRVDIASGEVDVGAVLVGAPGRRQLQVRCAQEGAMSLSLAYAHAYDAAEGPAATWRLELDVRPSLPTRQRRALVAAADLDERLPGDPDDLSLF